MEITAWSDAMLFSTVLIECQLNDGGEKSGTGFFYFRRVHKNGGHEVLVTNRHVIEDASRITVSFHALAADNRPLLGEICRVTVDRTWWRFHPDANIDVAFLLMEPLYDDLDKIGGAFFRNIDYQSIPTAEQLASTFPIEDVTFIGYPNGIYDRKNYLPIVRKGVTATSLQVDYNREPMFLISAPVFPGSSGSPVFLHDAASFASRRGFELSPRLWFLGILTSFKYREAPGWFEFDGTPVDRATVAAQESLDLGVVFKERTIREAIDHHLVTSGKPPDDLTRA